MPDKIVHKIIVSYLLFPKSGIDFLTVVIPLVVKCSGKKEAAPER